jgi:CTP synthase (UTP-ammonia lyase)
MLTKIALVGDYNPEVIAHQAIPLALKMAGQSFNRDVAAIWISTTNIVDSDALRGCQGFWCVPGSPYQNMQGALLAIAHARQSKIPFLGTCGGFQHAILEYARNVLGWSDAEHAETAPSAARAVISPLSCSLVDVQSTLRFICGSKLASIYGVKESVEGYHCRYGLNRTLQEELFVTDLQIAAIDLAGDVRAVELMGHPFFVATLFQPERMALQGRSSPVVRAFVNACCDSNSD